MVEKKDDGGPAFPQVPCPDCGVQHEPEHVPGMTLRDYFAAKSMQATIGKVEFLRTKTCEAQNARVVSEVELRHYFNSIANSAYAMAEAMLKARG